MTKSRIMSTAEAISRIADELKRRNDAALIEEITLMLGIEGTSVEEPSEEYRAWMVERARLAEEDIKAGRVFTLDEVRSRLRSRFGA